MTPEEKRAKKNAYMREYYRSGKGKEASDRYRHSEKGKAKLREVAQTEAKKNWFREYRKSNTEKERKRAWNNSEAGRVSKRQYNKSDKGRAMYARFRQTDKYKQWYHEYSKLKRAKAPKLLPLGEYMKRALLAEPIYAQVDKIVPYKYPRDVRDDIIMEIVLAVLEGTHTVESASKNLSKFAPSHHRDSFKQVSIDAPVAGTDNLRIGDRIAADAFHF